VDEEADGGVVTAVATENATSVTVDDERFEVADGNLKLAAGTMLDFETDTSPIDVTITASGDGESATHTISVSINDVNEAPTISVADGTTPDGMEAVSTVAENVTGALLGEITLSDADAGQTHTLSTSDEKFVTKQDDAGGWWLALADDASLSYEDGAEVTVTVTVTDDGDPAMSASVDVTITVTDVNEAPTIEVADGETPDGMPASSTVDENNAGAILGAIRLSDPDEGQTHTLEVTGDDRVVAKQDDAGGWWLALADGESFDFEADGDSIDVTVTVTDDGDTAMSASADVTITINDVNESPEADDEVEVPNAVFVAGQENSMEVDLKALFMDPDGDALTYSLSDNAPEWLQLSVTRAGSGDDQTITGRIHGTAPAENDMTIDDVSIIASDGEFESEAMFDVVVDAENDEPTSLELRITDDGVVIRTDEVDVNENEAGAELGQLIVRDPDDDRHPHGQHEFSVMVGDDADDRFEVTDDGTLKLKDDVFLDHEQDSEIVLTVMAKDMYVTAPGEDDEDTRESVSLEITITVTDVAAGDGPTANPIGDWWVTVDDRLDAEDAREGEWLSFRLDTSGDDAAFIDEGDMTYSVAVADADGDAVDWLQIDDESGAMTNVEGKVPEAGVYTVTVTATDEDDNSTSTSFKLAVALGELDHSDNDEPDIRNVDDIAFTEGSAADESVSVASFEIRDDDIGIAPHPYGTLEVTFTAKQGGAIVTNRFKLVELGNDGDDTARYEIHHKSDAELAVDDEGEPLVDAKGEPAPIKPIDYESGDQVVFEVTAKDGNADFSETDNQTIRVDIEDAADAAPRFSAASIDGAKRMVDPETKAGTTTLTVDQQEDDKEVIVLQLADLWSDPDTDSDDLRFDVDNFMMGDEEGLPDWVDVYGPREWEDIYGRVRGIDKADSSARDRDMVVAIVIDRTAATGNNEDVGNLVSFELTARDGPASSDSTNSTTETISIYVKDTEVDIIEDADDPVVEIEGDPNGTGSLTIEFDAAQDPDLDSADDATLVLYTWSHDNGTPDDAADDVTISVSSTPQPLRLDVNRDGVNDYVDMDTGTAGNQGARITATVMYYEVDPANRQIVPSDEYSDTTKTVRAPAPGETPDPSATFDITTTDAAGTAVSNGLAVAITVANTIEDGAGNNVTAVTARLESSNDGSDGSWQRAGADVTGALTIPANTSTGTVTLTLPVDEDDDNTPGDGGGLYYRVVLTYGTGSDATTHTSPAEDKIQLGSVTTDPTTTGLTDIIGVGADGQATVGETIRVDTGGTSADVQWQVGEDGSDANTTVDAHEWMDIDGATDLALRVTNMYDGKSLRAKVTYKAEDNPATRGVDETGWVTWVEYTEVGTVPGGTQSAPEATQITKEIEVELPAMTAATKTMPAVQPGKVQMGSTDSLFHDPDEDSLTYSIAIPASSTFGTVDGTGFTENLITSGNTVGDKGARQEVLDGGLVYVTYETEAVDDDGTVVSSDVGGPQQTLAIDKNTGEITYFTNMSHGHDGSDTDGGGNVLTFTVSATDGPTASNGTAYANISVRINVAPTAINLQSASDDSTNLFGTAADLPAPSTNPLMPETGTALLVADNTNIPNDTDNDPDNLTFMDDERNDAQRVANINVRDENATDHDFGTHKVTLSGRGSNMFEVKETSAAADDSDGSTWEIHLKEGATFDFEALRTAKEKEAEATTITLSITVTATDGAGLSTKGVFSVKLVDANTEDDPKAPKPTTPPEPEGPETPGLKDDTEGSDEDGPVPPPEDEEGPEPGDGGMFIDDLIGDDLLGDYVLAIDDVDIA